jgi:hypothetical protein
VHRHRARKLRRPGQAIYDTRGYAVPRKFKREHRAGSAAADNQNRNL